MKGIAMIVNEKIIDNYVRTIKISFMGKSNEAQNGAYTIVQNLLSFAHALKEEDKTYEAMVGMLKRLSEEMPKRNLA
jgi:nitrate reductase assembly molybdenum cofactor insertion protein NarJ